MSAFYLYALAADPIDLSGLAGVQGLGVEHRRTSTKIRCCEVAAKSCSAGCAQNLNASRSPPQ